MVTQRAATHEPRPIGHSQPARRLPLQPAGGGSQRPRPRLADFSGLRPRDQKKVQARFAGAVGVPRVQALRSKEYVIITTRNFPSLARLLPPQVGIPRLLGHAATATTATQPHGPRAMAGQLLLLLLLALPTALALHNGVALTPPRGFSTCAHRPRPGPVACEYDRCLLCVLLVHRERVPRALHR
jgi:hypothetical protein